MSLFQGIFSNLLENKYVSSPAMLFDFKKKQTVNELLKKIIKSIRSIYLKMNISLLKIVIIDFHDKT